MAVSLFFLCVLQVEFALKLGYPEKLTQKALIKVGMSGCQVRNIKEEVQTFNGLILQDELLNELIRLQQSKVLDPKVKLTVIFKKSFPQYMRLGSVIERDYRAFEINNSIHRNSESSVKIEVNFTRRSKELASDCHRWIQCGNVPWEQGDVFLQRNSNLRRLVQVKGSHGEEFSHVIELPVVKIKKTNLSSAYFHS